MGDTGCIICYNVCIHDYVSIEGEGFKKLVGIDIKWKELILSLSILSLQIMYALFYRKCGGFFLLNTGYF